LFSTGACVIFSDLAIERVLKMRFLAILAVSAFVLTPVLASADPGQSQAAPATAAQAAAATPAPQQTAQATPAAAPTNSAANLDQIECRTSPPPTGTRLGGSRECHTLRDWNQRQQDAQDDLKRTQMLGHQAQPLSGPGGK
jgi:cytochrome c5